VGQTVNSSSAESRDRIFVHSLAWITGSRWISAAEARSTSARTPPACACKLPGADIVPTLGLTMPAVVQIRSLDCLEVMGGAMGLESPDYRGARLMQRGAVLAGVGIR
jgi:hypothetical protein